MQKKISLGQQVGEPAPDCKKIQDYMYRFSDLLGMGNFSKVFKGTHQPTNKQVAIKIIELSSLNSTRLQQLLNTQTKILKMMSHPNVIGCEEILSSSRNCYMITELCNGGDLQKRLRKVVQVKERDLYHIAVDIYEGLKYLAKKHIVHRDIKVSNIFINNGVHKIADFGFAQISENQFKDISVGSPIYMSPEGYLNNIYGPKTDIWAFGVMLFQLVQGRTPCHQCRTQTQLKFGLLKQVDFSSFKANISTQLKNMIIGCLTICTSARIGAFQLQQTEWMKKAYKVVSESNRKDINLNENHRKSVQISGELLEELTRNRRNSMNVVFTHVKNQTNSPLFTNALMNHTANQSQPQISEPPIQQQQQQQPQTTIIHPINILVQAHQQQLATGAEILAPFQRKVPAQSFKKHDGIQECQAGQQKRHRRRHSSLEKTKQEQQELELKENQINQIKDKENKQNKDVAISPKNNPIKIDKALALKSTITSNKMGHNKSFTNLTAINNNNIDKSHQKQKQNSSFTRYKSAWEKSANTKDKQNQNNSHAEKQNRKQFKNLQNLQTTVILNSSKPHIKEAPTFQRTRNSISDFGNVFLSANLNKLYNKQQQKDTKKQNRIENTSFTSRRFSLPSQPCKVLSRILKFKDSISVIHYCRLCHKLGVLMQEYDEQKNTKTFLTQWAVQLLNQISDKVKDSTVTFGSDKEISAEGKYRSAEKQQKLKDVTGLYLEKYTSELQEPKKVFTIKQASNFIYNLYLNKSKELSQKSKDKKNATIYYALLSYVSALDRETRNLYQYIYGMKTTIQGKQIQKLLSIKVNEFSQKNIQNLGELQSDNKQNKQIQV